MAVTPRLSSEFSWTMLPTIFSAQCMLTSGAS
jgi:hypothetical protein